MKDVRNVEGKLPIDFGEERTTGSPSTTPSSSSRSQGQSPPLTTYNEIRAATTPAPSPKPLFNKRRQICIPNPRTYANKNKEELKAILRSKRLLVTGLKDELIDRLEKADRGQTNLLFQITVPQSPKVTEQLPRTPHKRRHRVEDEDQLEEEDIQPSQKEVKLGEEEIEDEGGGEGTEDVVKLNMGRKEVSRKEEMGEKEDLKERKIKKEEVGKKEELNFPRDLG